MYVALFEIFAFFFLSAINGNFQGIQILNSLTTVLARICKAIKTVYIKERRLLPERILLMVIYARDTFTEKEKGRATKYNYTIPSFKFQNVTHLLVRVNWRRVETFRNRTNIF